MKDLGFGHKGKERRDCKRYPVCWDAILEAKFPDLRGQLPVKIVNFSAGGALLHSEKLTVDDRHLVASDVRPELRLKISLPESTLDLTTKIVQYDVLDQKSIFEIGVSFVNFKKESGTTANKVIKIMKKNPVDP